jgi:hypothetical protein
MDVKEKIVKLEKATENIPQKKQKEHFVNFCKSGSYHGNGIYSWVGQMSTDSRELYLLGMAVIEGINVKGVTDV